MPHAEHVGAAPGGRLIADDLRTNPARTDRQIAAGLGVDHKTVASVRCELERIGEIPQCSTRTTTDGREYPSDRKPPRPSISTYQEPPEAEDDQLERMAKRIRARAVRRSGELLKQIEPGKTGPKTELDAGGHTQFTREGAARDAGMSPHQAKQSVRTANAPEQD